MRGDLPYGVLPILVASSMMLAAETAGAQSIGEGERKLVTLQGIRSATAAQDGLGFGALAFTMGPDAEDGEEFGDSTASVALGFGLGDSSRAVAVQVTANILSASDGFGDDGSLGVKFSRRLTSAQVPIFVGLSLDGLAGWGVLEGRESASLAVTAFPQVTLGGQSYPLMLTLGAGTDIVDNQSEPGLYAGAGIGLTRNFGASLAWTGESVTLGTAFRIDGLDSARFSASVSDVFDQEDERSITVAASFFVDDLFGR